VTTILGLNAYHADSSACLLCDGELVAAVEEERFTRVKHWAGLPVASIRYCLDEAGIRFRDVSIIAVNSNPTASLLRRIAFAATRRINRRLIADRIRSRAKRRSLPDSIASALGAEPFQGRTCFVEHHLAHLASAFYCSPFDRAVALSVDASGDFASTAWGLGEYGRLKAGGRIHFPHSLGIFYETITHFLGFKSYGDEYKVMGLASYGQPAFLSEMQKIVELDADGGFRLNLDYFSHHQGKATFQWEDCSPRADDYFTPNLSELLGAPREPGGPITARHKDIARSAQEMYERALFNLLGRLHDRYGVDALALSGGCAFNSVANGKVYRCTPFRKLYVQPAAGDAGGALGAALQVWHARLGNTRTMEMKHAFWGPHYSDTQIDSALHRRRNELGLDGCRWEKLANSELVQRAAMAISKGRVVGWFQGRMEWGPRALGNRSILADPRRADMKEVLNEKIKRRESFRPFAPAVLRSFVSEWFEIDDQVPFMMKVFPVHRHQRERIPAVTHVDGTGRLQTVEESEHPLFFRLIDSFRSLTGVPMLLNTSFNENEPIVCSVDQAIDCFLRTHMDMLVLGDRVLERPSVESPVVEQATARCVSADAVDE